MCHISLALLYLSSCMLHGPQQLFLCEIVRNQTLAPLPQAPMKTQQAGKEGKAASSWRQESLYATSLVAEVLRDGHPGVIARWAPQPESIRDAMAAALNVPEVQQPGGNLEKGVCVLQEYT